MNKYKIAEEIIRLSTSKNWDLAKLEWHLEDVYFEDEPETCLCGHTPIIEVCILKNKNNGNTARVGNICVKKFMGLDSDKIFQSVKRIKKDVTKSLSAEALQYAFQKNWIFLKDRDFYISIMKKRLLTEKQLKWKKDINLRVLSRLSKQ
ncbi:hypothetical protein [Micavibrio aeruginosavorus]|uniref:hypothetical protein n=1 Tax=Micavibrio aeruginosavorus TaxID=349221 RepID=UPI0005A01C7F|nr:hypothetical protein [Micavibrio aeruginosavorus]